MANLTVWKLVCEADKWRVHGVALLDAGANKNTTAAVLGTAARFARMANGASSMLLGIPPWSLPWPSSLEHWKRALTFEGAAEVEYVYGRAFYECGLMDAAVEQYQRTVSSYPRYWPAHANLASAYSQLGKYESALEAVQEAIIVVEDEVIPPSEKKHINPKGGRRVRRDGWSGESSDSVESNGDVLAELCYQKGSILTNLPENRCAGGTCPLFAAESFRRALNIIPTHELAHEELVRLTANLETKATSREYITSLFDE